MTKRRAAGDGGLFQRADGMWCGVVDIPTEDGTRKQKRVYSKSYATARDKLDELKDNIAKGVIPSTTMTVGKWLPYWLDEIHRPHIRPKTYRFYEESVRLHLVPAIGPWGGVVRAAWGRVKSGGSSRTGSGTTCPPPSSSWRVSAGAPDDADESAGTRD